MGIADENLLGLAQDEKLEKEKFDRAAQRKKKPKKDRSSVRVNPTGDRAHNRSSFLRRASTLTRFRRRAKIPKPPTPQNLPQQRGAEIAMSRKQQPNSHRVQNFDNL